MGGIDGYTKLLIHCDGVDESTTFTDEIGTHTITANGTAQVDTAQKVFGTGSALFDGNSDDLSIPDHADWNFGTGNFSIDFRIRFNTLQTCQIISQFEDTGNRWFALYRDTTNLLEFTSREGGVKSVYYKWDFSSVAVDTWYHVEITRSGSNMYCFVNGIALSVDTIDTAVGSNDLGDFAGSLYIGQMNSDNYLFGWLDEIRISKGIARHTANFIPPTAAYSEGSPTVSTSKYSIEYRDKSGNLVQYLTPYAKDISWEWNRHGGCGRAKMNLTMNYRKITFNTMDDIQIRVADLDNGGTKLVYRGWIASVTPITSGGDTDKISLDIRGYFDLLKFIIVQDSGTTKTYTSELVSDVVDDIIDTFIVANSSITKGAIDASSFTADTLEFKNTVYNALQTCFDLVGDVDYGIDQNLQFFWIDESTSVAHKFIVGNNVKNLRRKTAFDKLVNKIYLEGGDVAGSKYLKTGTASDSITAYYLAEKIISNSAIVTSSVADQYLDTILDANNAPKNEVTIDIPESTLRMEDNLPLGKVSVYDPEHDVGAASSGVWGIVSPDGGSGFIWGTTGDGGSGKIWGGGAGVFQEQVNNIKYSLSNTTGKFNIQISTSKTNNDLAARMNQIEHTLETVRQRS